MTAITYYRNYKEIRRSYLEVKRFLETETGEDGISLKTQVGNDLGYDGDDSLELLNKFIDKYQLDYEGFDFSKHFLTEGEIGDGGGVVLELIFLPITILIWLVKLLSFGKFDMAKGQKFPDIYRDTLDLSFGDLLTWYLSGKFVLRSQAKCELMKAV